jgi:protein-tyrosine phosphatase
VICFHNHLLPGVDDGAADLEQALLGLETMAAQGVRAVVVSPHLNGSATLEPDRYAGLWAAHDAAWEALRATAAVRVPALRLERGAEVMLDVPAPLLDDPRLRLAATPFVLVEFPFLLVPPGGDQALAALRAAGWLPVLAHPERYPAAGDPTARSAACRQAGAWLQVNAGSLLGRYGEGPRRAAWALLEAGLADYLCSDFHARGSCHLAAARQALLRRGGEGQAQRLLDDNPARLLRGEPPLPVPPLPPQRTLWRRLLRRG